MADNLQLAKALREAQATLQGASNAAASNVSAPVDALAWLLRKAGVPVGDAPVGGSDWMRQHGLTAEAPGVGGLIGESVGGVVPIVASAKAAQLAKGLLQAGENLAAPRTLNPQTGAIVFHGSPHKFDRFDASKIGTGEGAQAYGHGLYFAESPGVAKSYQEALAKTISVDGRPILQNNKIMGSTGNQDLDTALIAHGGDIDLAIQNAEANLKHYPTHNIAEALNEIQQLKALRGRVQMEQSGALYKVDLPDEAIARMLDWDKPLSQQPESVRAALTPEALGLQYQQLPNGNHAFVNAQGTRVGNMQKGGTSDSFRTNWLDSVANSRLSGREVYQSINDGMFGANKAAAALRQAGIPGIRYLDGGSRSAGQGSSNYVVFPGNESLLTILERNNQPLGIK